MRGRGTPTVARDLVNKRKEKLVDERKGMKGKLMDERKGKPVKRKSGGHGWKTQSS